MTEKPDDKIEVKVVVESKDSSRTEANRDNDPPGGRP